MNHSGIPFTLLLLFGAFLLHGCGSDSNPADVDDNDNGNTQTVITAMVVDGGPYSNVAVSFDTATAKISYRSGRTLTQFDIKGSIEAAKPVAGAVVQDLRLSLQFPDSTVAEHSWSKLMGDYSIDIAVVEIDGDKYYPISGKTHVERYDSAVVSGTFSGTLFSPTAQREIVITEGRFTGRRPAASTGGTGGGTGKKPQDHDLFFVLNGGEFSNDTIAILSTSSLAWAENDGGAYLNILLSGGEALLSGGESVNVAGTIEFPGSVAGTAVWGSKKHSRFVLNLNGEIYVGTSGITRVTQYGQSFFSVVAGEFSGTIVHSQNGGTLSVKNGWFKCARGN